MLRMQEELEVALESGSEGEGPQPEWLKDKVVSVDNAAKRRRSKTAGPSHPDSEVQDLTGTHFVCRCFACCVPGVMRSLLKRVNHCRFLSS